MKFIRQNKFHLRYVNQLQERKAESDAKLIPQIVNLDTFLKPIF